MEQYLESFLGVRFLATEYVTGKAHGGRIDTLGLDDNNCPVIIEYKRALNENVISQGLYYLDWLMDHQGEFTLQVVKRLGSEWADKIDWSGPRLLCIAGDFSRYDEYAVLQIPRNIELLRYRRYGGDLLLLELVRASTTVPTQRRYHSIEAAQEKQRTAETADTGTEPKAVQDVWESLKAFLSALGDDVQNEGTRALYRVPAPEELRLRQTAQPGCAGLDTAGSVLRVTRRGIHPRRK